ncbi:hypothetical protein SISSUDRAFT_1122235 [Sistotremastrum suecicum HHB10207 ss-3]|uniref:Uncharacterized protein n=1 Tax=Sistotremastrum suecicum HHB10207 ss-3 TaxID=1314776 RepID=A0A165ZN48_9AGAM|nr:hypothetical protein SISSUDRAFT_1122235 [Sistotremastrum suecicum HHB10207 ss-3]
MTAMTCPAPLSIPSNVTDIALLAALGGLGFTLSNQTGNDLDVKSAFLSLYCGAVGDVALNECYGICPNPDITGIGVRLSFWIQSILNAILVLKSPPDSNLASWSATMLTIAIVVPAIYQKSMQALTLYHATQVLNFATFSTVTSLAVAPLCDIWRETEPGQVAEQENQFDGDAGFADPDASEDDPERRLKKIRESKTQTSRALLSASFIMQISLQWTWCIILFTSPTYAQTPCSGSTFVFLFGFPFRACEINHGKYAVYPLWLLFCMCVVLFWGILLVFASSPSFYPILSRPPTMRESRETLLQKIVRHVRFLSWDRKRLFLVFTNTLVVLVALLLLWNSERQAWTGKNQILLGENTILGFGQVAALLLGVTPAAGLIVALHNQSIERAKRDRERAPSEEIPLIVHRAATLPGDLDSGDLSDIESGNYSSAGSPHGSSSSINALGLQDLDPQPLREEDIVAGTVGLRERSPLPPGFNPMTP